MIDWNDNAKAAVRAFADYIGQTKHCERYIERIVPPQTKTVTDAVEGKKIDISEMRDGMTVKCVRADSGCYKVGERYLVGRDEDGYFGPLNEKGLASFNHQAYSFELVETDKQEGEKWTHVTSNGTKCNIIVDTPDIHGRAIVIGVDGEYMRHPRDDLKPIKPTISKDAKRQLELYVQYRVDKYGDYAMKSDLSDYLSHHNII